MYQNVLVPLVLDDQTELKFAISVAQTLVDQNGTITLLHVVEDVPGYVATYLPEGTIKKNIDGAITKLKAIANNISGRVDVEVTMGHASLTILDFAHQINADCIVIQSHRPGIGDYFLGSTAARIVRHAICAVHVVR